MTQDTGKPVRLFLLLLLVGAAALALTLPITSTTAQDTGPAFATNTPRPTPPAMLTPNGPVEFYALRLWLEQDFIDMLTQQVRQLTPDDAEGQRAVQILQQELARRFPNALSRADRRASLLAAMLAAPRGMVDMRAVVRPTIQDALNQNPMTTSFQVDGFHVDLTPANVDGVDPIDALVHTVYPANVTDMSAVLYEDYVFATLDARGRYTIVSASPDYPVAPLGDVSSVTMQRLEDVNGDSLDEVALAVTDSYVNKEMRIYGWRNGQIINLVAPGAQLRFGLLKSWTLNEETHQGDLVISNYRLESPEWGCLSEVEQQWSYVSNFFRPVQTDLNAQYVNQNSLACRLYAAEPIFSSVPGDAITTLEEAINDSSAGEPGRDRALMTLAMLYALDGRPSSAVDLATQLNASAVPDSWLARETAALINTLGAGGKTALDVCEEVMRAAENPACNMDQVIQRRFEDNPLTTAENLFDQLDQRGLPVLESVTVSQIGLRDRTVVSFNRYGTSWWAFAPLPDGKYLAEITDPPAGFEAASFPLGFLDAPQNAYDALFQSGSAAGALNVLNTLMANNPGLPLSPSALYLQALSYEMAGDRADARQSYYGLWTQYPNSLWGQLAARHLERR